MTLWWIRNDGCGMISAFLTVGLLIYAQVVMTKIVILPWLGFSYHLIIYSIITLFALVAHTRSQFTDPGAVPYSLISPELPPNSDSFDPQNPPPVSLKVCKHCKTLKPKSAYHCSICKRCIVRMDHHCPWINNCVGIHNQKNFILFLFYTGLACIYCAVMLIARFLSCSSSLKKCDISGINTALCIINFVEALIFGLFVIIMMFDQFSAIFSANDDEQNHYEDELEKYNDIMRRGGVDYMPMPEPPKPLSMCESLTETMGGYFGLSWFIPFDNPVGLWERYEEDINQAKIAADQRIKVLVQYLKHRKYKEKNTEDSSENETNDEDDESEQSGDDVVMMNDFLEENEKETDIVNRSNM